MATAVKNLKPVLPVKPEVASVTLTLSPLEAQEIANVLAKVGGSGPRRYRLNVISDSLRMIEVVSLETKNPAEAG